MPKKTSLVIRHIIDRSVFISTLAVAPTTMRKSLQVFALVLYL